MAQTPGGRSSEFSMSKTAGVAGGGGILLTIITMLQGEDGVLADLSWPQVALLGVLVVCLTAVIVSYNISRGLAKYEGRDPEDKTVTIKHTTD